MSEAMPRPVKSVVIDLDAVDLDTAKSVVKPVHGHDTITAIVCLSFGWLGDTTFCATDADQLDRFVALLTSAARDLRGNPDTDLDAWPAAS